MQKNVSVGLVFLLDDVALGHEGPPPSALVKILFSSSPLRIPIIPAVMDRVRALSEVVPHLWNTLSLEVCLTFSLGARPKHFSIPRLLT